MPSSVPPVLGETLPSDRASSPANADNSDVTGSAEERPCAFCEGNESLTPPEVFALRSGGGTDHRGTDRPGWTVRVVPNLYPAVQGPGRRHEVVVHSPTHKTCLKDLSAKELSAVATAWTARLDELSQDPRVTYFQAGLNQGSQAGASLEHSHSQLLALDFEPPTWKAEKSALDEPDSCPLCQLLASEASSSQFLVASGVEGVGFCPPWAEFPFEVVLLPRQHLGSISLSFEALEWAVSALARLSAALQPAAGSDAFNVVLHTALPRTSAERFHWHAHIYPRVAVLASLELGTGVFIQTMDPAMAAERLRPTEG